MLDIKTKVTAVNDTDADLLTLAEAKNYLRVDDDNADDALITSLITAARAAAETYINRDILAREREMFIYNLNGQSHIELLYGTIDADTNVSITIDGKNTTEDSEWSLEGPDDSPYVVFENPNAENVQIAYTTAGLVGDESAKQGVQNLLYSLYEFDEVKPHYWTILSPLKQITW